MGLHIDKVCIDFNHFHDVSGKVNLFGPSIPQLSSR